MILPIVSKVLVKKISISRSSFIFLIVIKMVKLINWIKLVIVINIIIDTYKTLTWKVKGDKVYWWKIDVEIKSNLKDKATFTNTFTWKNWLNWLELKSNHLQLNQQFLLINLPVNLILSSGVSSIDSQFWLLVIRLLWEDDILSV